MENSSILIVDDEPVYLELLKGILDEEGYSETITEQNPKNVAKILQQKNVDVILIDNYMPQMKGMDLLEFVSQNYPKIPVIMVTGSDDVETAIKATKLGAYEYITKPPDTDRLLLTIKRALEQRLLKLERDSLRSTNFQEEEEKTRYPEFDDIITESHLMQKAFELVKIFAPTSETILVIGETGTGKDLIAKKIHQLSPRKENSFVVVNLASISSSLFESELFGYEKGAFTGAGNERMGYFEAANGGTIFLDEIGELPKELQGKLLRTIQYGEIFRIGSPLPIKLDIRIVAATNKNLLEAVNNKEFRADLFYRLNRGFIHLPPLRIRGEKDIFNLADHFLKTGNKTYRKKVAGFSPKVYAAFKEYSFPGNIRELENIVLNAVAKTASGEKIEKVDLPENYFTVKEEAVPKQKLISIEDAVNEHVKNIVDYCSGSIKKAASILGVSERTLQRKIKALKN